MIYAITKYTKQQIATMDVATLRHAVKIYTDKIYAECLRAEKDAKLAKPGADQKCAIAKRDEANKKWDDYIAEQGAMLNANKQTEGYSPYKYAIVPTGEFNENGKEMMHLITREEPLCPLPDEGRLYAEDERMMGESPEWERDDGDDWENEYDD